MFSEVDNMKKESICSFLFVHSTAKIFGATFQHIGRMPAQPET